MADFNLGVSTVNIGASLGNMIGGLLYHEAMRNLNWSRDYLWYAELSGVPNPFQSNGVLGFPATSITYTLTDGELFTWNGSMEEFAVPKSKRLCDINISFIDDEQQTLLTFFERWYNNIYNINTGVLPLTECCYTLNIYSLKSTRSKVRRAYFDYSVERNYTGESITESIVSNTNTKITDCRQFYVYPDGPLQEQLTYSGPGNPREYTVRLVVAGYVNADFGNPSKHESTNELFDKINNATGSDILSKMADYI